MTAAPGTPVDEPHALILSRTMILLVLGSASAMTNFGGAGILNFYALHVLLSFSLSLPLLGLRGRTLTIIAVVLAVVTPQLAFGLRALLT